MEARSVSTADAVSTVFALPLEQRIQLAQDLWDSVAQETGPESPPLYLTDEQRAEIDRRLAEMKANPSMCLSEEEFWRRVRGGDDK